jgi:hypothetical protein
VRELRPVPPPAELRAIDRHRSTPVDHERLTPPDRRAPHLQAEAAEPRTTPQEARERTSSDRQRQDQPSEALVRFEPTRAGLPDVAPDDAARYIETRRGDRPWLNTARHAPTEVQRLFATLDQGNGHSHIRHEGWLSAEKSQLRVQYLQDPAQLDPVKKAAGEDGLLPGGKKHYCAEISAAIRDPTAFAEAFARGTEHPDIRQALEIPLGKGHKPPQPVGVPIANLLGPDGHRCCEGYRLAGDDGDAARQDRRTWLQETRAGERPSVPPPLIVPVDFRGGTIQFRFKVNAAKTNYEVATMFPDPPHQKPEQP